MTDIPVNCVFNKGVTGCGATTLAIKQPGHTILAMPFRGLVQNKVASNPNLLGIHGKLNNDAEIIAKYLDSHDTHKIAVIIIGVILCLFGLSIVQSMPPVKKPRKRRPATTDTRVYLVHADELRSRNGRARS